MRKKLLALLMCATMVLGTGMTAMADSVSDAKKVYGDNADLFIAEYYKADDVITDKVYKINDSSKSLTYAYQVNDDGTYTPVAVNSDKKPIYRIADNSLRETVDYANPSVTISSTTGVTLDMASLAQVLPAYTLSAVKASDTTVYVGKKTEAKLNVLSSGTTLTDKNGNKVATITYTANEIKSVAAASNKQNAAAEYYVQYDANGNKLHDEYMENGVVVVSNPTFDANKLYVTNKTVDGITLLKGNTNILKSSSDNKVYTQLSKASEDNTVTNAIADAIEREELSSKAVAVRLDVFQQTSGLTYVFGTNYTMPKQIKAVDYVLDGEFSFDADTLSRTGLAGASALNVYTLADSTRESKITGTQVQMLKNIATANVGSTYAFANDAFTNHIVIFDVAEASNKDGASDTTTDTTTAAAASTTNSPKTGDVAPIAALAVVMMGACGAMVVASKKRA